jgi:hypothetical protein
MSHKLKNSQYTFTDNYIDGKGRVCKAMVVLNVNYDNKSYTVLPHGTTRNEFGFVSDSKYNHQMWKAVIHLIEEAVDYGESLVNPPTPVNKTDDKTDEVISEDNVL